MTSDTYNYTYSKYIQLLNARAYSRNLAQHSILARKGTFLKKDPQNLPYDHVWNTVVMSGLVLLVVTWICWISYKSRYTGLLVLHLLLCLNPWLSIKMQPAYSVFSIGITLVDVHLNWLHQFHFFFLAGGLLVILIDCMIFQSPFLDVTWMSMLTVSFLTQVGSGIFCVQNALL